MPSDASAVQFQNPSHDAARVPTNTSWSASISSRDFATVSPPPRDPSALSSSSGLHLFSLRRAISLRESRKEQFLLPVTSIRLSIFLRSPILVPKRSEKFFSVLRLYIVSGSSATGAGADSRGM